MSVFLAGKSSNFQRQLLALLALLFYASLGSPSFAAWHLQHQDLMGTRITVEVWHLQTAVATVCSDRVFHEIDRIEAVMSSYRSDSELNHINNNAAISVVSISPEMRHLIEQSLHYSEISAGAFDITYASIGYAYDYRKRLRPSDQAITNSLGAINYRHIRLDTAGIHFLNPAVRINLGGIAKGYAVDRAIDILRDCGIDQAMVSAGGDSRIIGDREGRPWVIGIQHPRDPAAVALRLPLSDSAISTSGDYERFFIENGERIHHIINPATGRSAAASWSASVTGDNALKTDALSTTIFILGAKKGLDLIERLEGVDAIIIDSDGKLHHSSGYESPEIDG